MINEVFWKNPFRYITEKKLRVLVQRTKLKAGRPAGRLQKSRGAMIAARTKEMACV